MNHAAWAESLGFDCYWYADERFYHEPMLGRGHRTGDVDDSAWSGSRRSQDTTPGIGGGCDELRQ